MERRKIATDHPDPTSAPAMSPGEYKKRSQSPLAKRRFALRERIGLIVLVLVAVFALILYTGLGADTSLHLNQGELYAASWNNYTDAFQGPDTILLEATRKKKIIVLVDNHSWFKLEDEYDHLMWGPENGKNCYFPRHLTNDRGQAVRAPVDCNVIVEPPMFFAHEPKAHARVHFADTTVVFPRWMHLAWFKPRQFAAQPRIGYTIESTKKRGYLVSPDPSQRLYFDAIMSFRLDSQIPVLYPPYDSRKKYDAVPPFSERLDAIMFLAWNCESVSGREDVVRGLMAAGIEVHSFGKCLPNRPLIDEQRHEGASKWRRNKLDLMAKYKFCFALENTRELHYVTEKVWDAYEAGCVPLYLGAPNVFTEFLPRNDSVMMVDDYLPDYQRLAADMKAVMANEERWQSYMAWKQAPFVSLNHGYHQLLRYFDGPSPFCLLCSRLLQLNIN